MSLTFVRPELVGLGGAIPDRYIGFNSAGTTITTSPANIPFQIGYIWSDLVNFDPGIPETEFEILANLPGVFIFGVNIEIANTALLLTADLYVNNVFAMRLGKGLGYVSGSGCLKFQGTETLSVRAFVSSGSSTLVTTAGVNHFHVCRNFLASTP
jgi:hypothetical protein